MKRLLYLLLFILWSCANVDTTENETFDNPIIPGFHPDPSICQVDGHFYLVTSSFEWFPGIPIFHSTDLMNWEQIGYVLDRPSQLNLDKVGPSMGVWAPTIRYRDGIYYVITKAYAAGEIFYVTSQTPYGPWSEPICIDAPGIDPSLFFDDDGKCWFTATINDTPEQDAYPLQDRIYIQELDLDSGKLLGERKVLTSGLATNSPYAEAPHIYKINGRYLLLIAEGGTWNNHAVTVFYSDSVTGPYVPGYINPVLTHRFLGEGADITTIGHADLVQSLDGRWWSVMLGVRPLNGYNMLGRETFITPVEFQNNCPIFNPGIGRVLSKEKVTGLPKSEYKPRYGRYEFDNPDLDFCWNFLRTPHYKWYNITNGKLSVDLRPEKITDKANPSMIVRRIEHFNYTARTRMCFTPSNENEEAGIIMIQNASYHYRLIKQKNNNADSLYLCKIEKGKKSILARSECPKDEVCLSVVANGLDLQFYVGESEKSLQKFGDVQDATIISTNKAGGFIGPMIGMYCSSNGVQSSNKAVYEYFEYQPTM